MNSTTEVLSKEKIEAIVMAPGITAWKHYDVPNVSMAEVSFEPEAVEPLHYHEKAQQIFMVLEGEALFFVGDETLEVNAGESLFVAPGIHHGAKNRGAGELRIQVVSQPSATGDRVDL